jgi:hypothetical protein
VAVVDRHRGDTWYGDWIYPGGTVIISGDQKEFNVDRSAQTIDVSAASDAARNYILGLKDAKFTLNLFDTGINGTALAYALREGTSGTLRWGPQGSAAGKPKFARAAIVDSHKPKYPFDGAVMLDVGLQGTGDFISDYGAVW